ISIEMVRVTPGMLPPTMSTTPNSPSVCAKLSANPVTSPAFERGSTIRRKVCSGEWPSDAEARSRLESTAPKEAANGCTANGRLYNRDPITRPSKVKAKVWPVSDSHQRPIGLRDSSASASKSASRRAEFRWRAVASKLCLPDAPSTRTPPSSFQFFSISVRLRGQVETVTAEQGSGLGAAQEFQKLAGRTRLFRF